MTNLPESKDGILFYWWLYQPDEDDVREAYHLDAAEFEQLRPQGRESGALTGYPGASYRSAEAALADLARVRVEAMQ